MNHYADIAAIGVRIAKYLASSGISVRGFTVSSSGRSVYVQIRGRKRLRQEIRVSDHPKTGRASLKRVERRSLLCVSNLSSWRTIRRRVKGFVMQGVCCDAVGNVKQAATVKQSQPL